MRLNLAQGSSSSLGPFRSKAGGYNLSSIVESIKDEEKEKNFKEGDNLILYFTDSNIENENKMFDPGRG